MKAILAVTVSLLVVVGSAWAQSATTGRGDDNYVSNGAAGSNASRSSNAPNANKSAMAGAKKSATDRKAVNQAAPGNSPAETAGAATPNDTSRPENPPDKL